MYGVYIVRCSDGTCYTGTAKDINTRIAVHNAAKGAKYTRTRLPVYEVHRELLPDRNAALSREAFIKGLSRAEKERLIADAPPTLHADGNSVIAAAGDETVLFISAATDADAVTLTRFTVSPRYRGHAVEAEAMTALLHGCKDKAIRFTREAVGAKRIIKRMGL